MVAVSPEQLRDDALRFFRERDLPMSLEWVDDLTSVNQRLFAVELADALKQATLTGDLRELVELLEDWEATAELDAAPEVVAEIERRQKERARRQVT